MATDGSCSVPGVSGIAQVPVKALRLLCKIARRNGWAVDGMAAAIAHESGWNPRAQNPGGSRATGLLQWIPSTARALFDLSVDQIRELSIEKQLPLAERYWKAASQGRQIGDLDFLILGLGAGNVPGGYRADLEDDVVLYPAGSAGARGNPGLQDPEGNITVGNARAALRGMLATRVSRIHVPSTDPAAEAAGPLLVVGLMFFGWLFTRRRGRA